MKLRAALIVAAGLLLAVALRPGTALGHAALLRAEPAPNSFLQRPPAQISLRFAESVDERNSSIRLLTSTGAQYTLPRANLSPDGLTLAVTLPRLDPGIYNVLWVNISRIDGHALRGSFPFTILRADGSPPDATNQVTGITSDSDPLPPPDGVAVRALSLLGLAIVAGGALLTLLWGAQGAGVRRGMERTIYFGAVILTAASLLNLATIRDAYAGTGLQDVLLHAPAGGYWLTRIGVVLLLAVGASFLVEAPRRTATALLAVSGIYVWAYTATSHAAAGVGSAWGRGVDFLHGVTAIAWIGAVIGVAISARLLQRKGAYADLFPRFSLLASVLVFILVVSGGFGALIEVDSTAKLADTQYGRILLIKLALLLPLLLVAAYNARIGRHRLVAMAPGEPRRFIATAAAEIVLGLGVFLAAAALTQTTASKSIVEVSGPKPYENTFAATDISIELNIDPNRTGINTYRVRVLSAGTPVDVDRVRLTFRYRDDETVGPAILALSRSDVGTYLGQGPYLTLEGNWRVEVEIRRQFVDDVVGFFDVRPAGAKVVGIQTGGAWDNPAPSLSWNQIGGLALVALGFGFAIWRKHLRHLGRVVSLATNGITFGGFAFGVLLLFGVHTHAPPGPLLTNPIVPDQNSISVGRSVYQQNCIACHGQSGVPPKGLNLQPYPLDLTVHVPLHPDGQLYKFIADGISGSAMDSWLGNGKLNGDQIWHLINFLRTLTASDR